MERPVVSKTAALAGHRDAVFALAGGPGRTVFSSGADGQVVAWDAGQPARDGELLARVENSVYALLHLPEYDWLALGHNYQGIQVISLADKALVQAVALPPLAVFALAHAPARRQLYAALGDGTLAVLTLPALRLERLVRVSTKSLRCLALHEGRAELAVGASDARTYVLDLDTLAPKQVLGESTNSVFAVIYDAGGRLLTAGRDAQIRAWGWGSEANGEVVGGVNGRTNSEADSGAAAADAAAAPAGYALAQTVAAHLYTINALALSPDGRWLASASLDKSIKIWDAHSLELLRVIDRARATGHGTSVNRLVWADGHTLVSASDDRTLGVFAVG